MAGDNKEMTGVAGWVDYRLPVISMFKHSLVDYPTPRNLNYFWNFGSIAGIMLLAQIITGVFLAMHYTAHVDHAFDSVEHIMRDVNYGWLLRYLHANGASMFFLVVFIHIFRGLYYGSYKGPRELLWWLGVFILLIMMASAFMGYVLPWGQMSFWGATVITNLFSAIPVVGDSIVTWLWGGFSVDNPTLNRFFALHYLLPMVLVGVVFLHIVALHTHGSNNPLGIDVKGKQDTVPFHPYYTVKDFFGFGVFFLIYGYFVFFNPNYLGHADNYIPADPLVTPAHIVPEWYFLPFYAILRAVDFETQVMIPGIVLAIFGWQLAKAKAKVNNWQLYSLDTLLNIRMFIPMGIFGLGGLMILAGAVGLYNVHVANFPEGVSYFQGIIPPKLGGVIAMFGSILVLLALPWLDTSKVRSGNYRPMFKPFYWLFLLGCIGLGYLGAKPAQGVYVLGAQILTCYYFAYFLLILPVLGKIEKPLPLPRSISHAVTNSSSKKA